MATQTIFVPELLPNTNTIYSSPHWSKRAKIASEWHMIILAACRNQKIKPVHRANLTFICTKSKGVLRDAENYFTKVATDGLVRFGIIVDDSPAYIPQITIRSEKGLRQGTTIIIEEID